MTAPNRLLAKSSATPASPTSAETLPGHTAQVLASARRILAAVGDSALCGADLDPEQWRDRLGFAVCFAAAIHDLGKANDQFQALLRRTLKHPQCARHESVTGLLMLGVLQSSVFKPACERDALGAWAGLIAACGHHRKFPNPTGGRPSQASPAALTVDTRHPDFLATCEIVAALVGVELGPLELPSWSTGVCNELEQSLHNLSDQLGDEFERVVATDQAKRFTALVRGLVFGADVAGSALPRQGLSICNWIDDALAQQLAPGDLDQILNAKLQGEQLRPFQQQVAASRRAVTVVTAACGTGKTAAAYAWARYHASGRKLLFCYPTTGTTSEGFRSYLLGTDVPAELLHSRASVDLEDMTVNGYGPEDRDDSLARIDSLRAWPVRVIACTVDTVLGALVFNRAGLFAFPALCNAAFVFDEIHAYDEQLFGLLLSFLNLFPRVPVLLMTASLSPARQRAIAEVIGEYTTIPGPPELERYDRYNIMAGPLDQPPWAVIKTTLDAGGKVLCVANVVARAVDYAQQAQARALLPGPSPLVYHSRFRYEDRVKRHREVMDAFDSPGPALAFTTQVCEMSLDLSADLLITEAAPAAALVQRLGRLNRRAGPDNPSPPKPAYCLAVPVAPYNPAEVQAGLDFWRALALAQQPLSQAKLSALFLESDREAGLRPAPIGLRDSARSLPEPVRDGGATINVILERDRDQVRRDRNALTRCAVPIPYRKAIAQWERVLGVPVAPASELHYDDCFGACQEPRT